MQTHWLLRLCVCFGARMWSVFFRGVCLIHNVPITSAGDQGVGLFQVIWKCSGDVRSVSFSPWDVVQCIIRCLLGTHKQVLGRLLEAGIQKLFCGVASGCQKLSRMHWWIRCPGDMWHGRSVYVERFPSLLPAETCLTCSHAFQAAGQQVGSPSAAGVMEHGAAWPAVDTEGRTWFTCERCLL